MPVKLVQVRHVWAEVVLALPGEDGQVAPATLRLRFRIPSQSQLMALATGAGYDWDAPGASIEAFRAHQLAQHQAGLAALADWIVDWQDVIDPDRAAPMPFDRDALLALLDWPGVAEAVTQAFMAAVRPEAAEKNSSAPDVPGP